MRVLLTNDDGIEAAGLQALRRALLALAGIELAVIAPDGNRSAMARSITTRRPLWVEEVEFGDGTVGYATDGTPVDCVRLARLGLVEGFKAELVVAGINHGAVGELEEVPLPAGTLLNINVPGTHPNGVEVARLGKRVYRDELALIDEGAGGRRLYRIYGDASYEADESETDVTAVAEGRIAVTPIHFDLTARDGLSALQRYDLARLIAPAAREVHE